MINDTNNTLDALSSPKGIEKRYYTAPEVIRITGMKRKQISYWEDIGLVVPTIHDTNKAPGQPALFYSDIEVVKALIFCDLRKRGFSLHQVKQVARNLNSLDIPIPEAKTYLLTDGYSVYYAYDDNEVVDVLKHHQQMLLLIPIHEQIAKLQEVA